MALNILIGKMHITKSLLQVGFTYIGLLAVVAIAAIGMAGTGIIWHLDSQREREKELLFIGEEYRKAIESYYESSPNGIKQFPSTLDDLVLDKRFPNIKRHIRKLYIDPLPSGAIPLGSLFTSALSLGSVSASTSLNDKQWGLILQQTQITGIYSLSKSAPVKKFGFATQYKDFGEATEYKEWRFNYTPNGVPNKASSNVPDKSSINGAATSIEATI